MTDPSICIIGEVAQAHDGSLGNAHMYIDSLAAAGADTVKFQMHIADAESSKFEPFRVKFSSQDETRFDYWKRMEFSPEQWRQIKNHCAEKNVEFLCSPFSIAAVDILESLNVKRYKIASGEVNNYLMLERIAETGKPILISTGMSNYKEIEETLNFLKPFGNDLSLFQTTTAYPTTPEQVGFNVLTELISRYDMPVGLSDHSGTIFPALAAVALGAHLIEVHAVFNKEMFGPDTKASLTIEEFAEMVEGIRFIEKAMAQGVNKDDVEQYTEIREIFGKSLALNRDMNAGDKLTKNDLESKKPGNKGISAKDFKSVIDKILKSDKAQYEFLNEEDIE